MLLLYKLLTICGLIKFTGGNFGPKKDNFFII